MSLKDFGSFDEVHFSFAGAEGRWAAGATDDFKECLDLVL